MTKKERALKAVEALERVYPDAVCSLTYEKPYELLISTRLSAQCTDARVNLVTPVLFSKFPSLQSLADAPIEEIEEIIKPCGLFHTKAKDIKMLSRMLIDDFSGQTRVRSVGGGGGEGIFIRFDWGASASFARSAFDALEGYIENAH